MPKPARHEVGLSGCTGASRTSGTGSWAWPSGRTVFVPAWIGPETGALGHAQHLGEEGFPVGTSGPAGVTEEPAHRFLPITSNWQIPEKNGNLF